MIVNMLGDGVDILLLVKRAVDIIYRLIVKVERRGHGGDLM